MDAVSSNDRVLIKENLKFTIGARNYKITMQLVGDLRSICVQEVGVRCMVV
jgi:hypothetical protein